MSIGSWNQIYPIGRSLNHNRLFLLMNHFNLGINMTLLIELSVNLEKANQFPKSLVEALNENLLAGQ